MIKSTPAGPSPTGHADTKHLASSPDHLMQRLAATFISLALVSVLHAKPSPLEAFEFSGVPTVKRQMKWPSRTIQIGLSTSLNMPGPNFIPGSDVMGAVHRALSRWAEIGNISFVESSVSAQSISGETGDGISLITIADTRENNAIFSSAEMTGRTRIFFNPRSVKSVPSEHCDA